MASIPWNNEAQAHMWAMGARATLFRRSIRIQTYIRNCMVPLKYGKLAPPNSINQSIYFAIKGHRPLTNHTSSTNITTERKAKLYKLCRYNVS